MEWKKGMMAVSKAGHDKGQWYIIYNIEGTDVFLVDGRIRTVDRPKKKKKKHVQLVARIPELLKDRSEQVTAWKNEEVKRALKLEKQD